MKLNVKAMALTLGLVCGLGLFLLTWWMIIVEGASGNVTVIGHVYRGYEISALGSLVGFLWGFVDGAIAGALIAWFYNRLTAMPTKPQLKV